MNIFITGTVGSGKSSFAKFLAKHLDPLHFEYLDLDVEAKKIIKEHNIELPIDKNMLFSDQMALFYIEKKVWSHLNIEPTNKTRVGEASTFFESPKLYSKEDIVICVDSDNFEKNVLNRDGIDRASLINKNQLSKKVKSICADYVISNNGSLEDLENKARYFAENLNHQTTNLFKQEISFIKQEWIKNFPELPQKLVNDIIKEYTRLDRFYHNQSHLVYLLLNFNHLVKEHIILKLWKRAIILAIFYHDVKMKFTLEAKNEADSIEFLFNSFKEFNLLKTSTIGSRSFVTLAADLILATQNHKTNEFISSSEFGDSFFKLFLDLDMLILSDPDNFNKYEDGIRKEWMNFSDEQYKLGRTKVLSSFLNEDIYLSNVFFDRNETAKNLISDLINKLKD